MDPLSEVFQGIDRGDMDLYGDRRWCSNWRGWTNAWVASLFPSLEGLTVQGASFEIFADFAGVEGEVGQ